MHLQDFTERLLTDNKNDHLLYVKQIFKFLQKTDNLNIYFVYSRSRERAFFLRILIIIGNYLLLGLIKSKSWKDFIISKNKISYMLCIQNSVAILQLWSILSSFEKVIQITRRLKYDTFVMYGQSPCQWQ